MSLSVVISELDLDEGKNLKVLLSLQQREVSAINSKELELYRKKY